MIDMENLDPAEDLAVKNEVAGITPYGTGT